MMVYNKGKRIDQSHILFTIFASVILPRILISLLKYKYILFAFLFAANSAAAQPSPDYNPLEPATEDTLYAIRNAFKFDPIQIFFGDFQVYFETMVGDKWSIEVGAGPTYRNYAASWFDYELDALGRNVDIKMRYALSLALRHYFADTGELYGTYSGLVLSHRRYDKTYSVVDDFGELVPGFAFDDKRRYTSLLGVLGYQALSEGSNIFADFYIAAGVRYKNFDIVFAEDIHNPFTYRTDRLREYTFGLQIGARIGFGF